MNMNLDAIRNGVSLPGFVAKLPRIPVASAISGLIVAALILMTPNPWFEAFIVESGLPSLLTAAEPPLGARARIVFALIAALIVTAAAWLVLSAILGRKMRNRSMLYDPKAYHEEDDQGPRIRRRVDSHPDAPFRRPIMAGEEMGVPLDLVTVPSAETGQRDSETDILDLGEIAEIVEQDAAFAAPAAHETDETDVSASAAMDDPDAAGAKGDDSEPLFEISLPRRDAVPEDTAEGSADHEAAGAAPVDRPSPSEIRSELADLVARLESGLKRKRTRGRSAGQDYADMAHENVTAHPQAQHQPQSGSDHDAALRDALDALQKIAGKAS